MSGQQTRAGALFDSVSDRWGELFVFTGFVWFLHDSPWLLAVMAALGGSMMVSYTRARAEGLGIELAGGMMQRAERILLVSVGTLLAAWYAADPDNLSIAQSILGVTMLICGAASTATAVSRWVLAYRELERRAKRTTAPAQIPAVAAALLSDDTPAEPAIASAAPAIASAAPARVLIAPHVRKVAPLEQH
jgi:phosphatidylglycerophosphate synthase